MRKRILYAVMEDGGRWRAVTSTVQLNDCCVALTPVEGYPVKVRYAADNVLYTHSCSNSCELGELLNAIGRQPKRCSLEQIWSYDRAKQDLIKSSRNRNKIFVEKDEQGLWVPKIGFSVPEGALQIAAFDQYPVSVVYSTSDIQGSSNYREAICESPSMLATTLREVITYPDTYLLHSVADYDYETSPVANKLMEKAKENDRLAKEIRFDAYCKQRNEDIRQKCRELVETMVADPYAFGAFGDDQRMLDEILCSVEATLESAAVGKQTYEVCMPYRTEEGTPCFRNGAECHMCPFK